MNVTDQTSITLTIKLTGRMGVIGITASSIAMQCSVCEQSFPVHCEFIGEDSDGRLIATRSLDARRRMYAGKESPDELDYREIGGLNEKL